MNIISARFSNEAGGILLDRGEDEPLLYVDQCDLYRRALAGEFGPVAPYEPEPEPEETLENP
jgi:hypothetical protein